MRCWFYVAYKEFTTHLNVECFKLAVLAIFLSYAPTFFGWNWPSASGEEDFLKFVNAYALFHNYLPLKKGGALHLNKLESPLPQNALCKVWLKLGQWFWRRRFLKIFNVFHNCQVWFSLSCFKAFLSDSLTLTSDLENKRHLSLIMMINCTKL